MEPLDKSISSCLPIPFYFTSHLLPEIHRTKKQNELKRHVATSI